MMVTISFKIKENLYHHVISYHYLNGYNAQTGFYYRVL
ncbi:hypothetical protein DDI_3993 [Dickeya dianthicola RNS04.9]|nr:hypothetical protein DDI_3993 [Dickeya dianthicola RNS04.9]